MQAYHIIKKEIRSISSTRIVHSIELEPGEYLLECWGADGGGEESDITGGTGGYSKITYKTEYSVTLYGIVGEDGTETQAYTSYNGGGAGKGEYLDGIIYGGGGATHIALTNRGELKNYENYKDEILIVAGGGGGACSNNNTDNGGAPFSGGFGGGLTGGYGNVNEFGVVWGFPGNQIKGGTKTTSSATEYQSGTFGKGGDGMLNNRWYTNASGGGGGWYGGSAWGGGGSGYITESNSSCINGLTVSVSEAGFVKKPTDRKNGAIRISKITRQTINQTSIQSLRIDYCSDDDYTGTEILLPKGEYKIECLGGNGGDCSTAYSTYGRGGYGGYSILYFTSNNNSILYGFVGGHGAEPANAWTGGIGGKNGGGSAGSTKIYGSYYAGGGGGGATHIAITDRGELKNYENYKDEILAVAGGGGGAAGGTHSGYCSGYEGGGTYGGGYIGGGYNIGGTPTAGGNSNGGQSGSFGIGGKSAYQDNGVAASGGGGGGGWYGGGGGYGAPSASYGLTGGGGGSGYVVSSENTNNKTYSYNEYPYYRSTLDGVIIITSLNFEEDTSITDLASFVRTVGSTIKDKFVDEYDTCETKYIDPLDMENYVRGNCTETSGGQKTVHDLAFGLSQAIQDRFDLGGAKIKIPPKAIPNLIKNSGLTFDHPHTYMPAREIQILSSSCTNSGVGRYPEATCIVCGHVCRAKTTTIPPLSPSGRHEADNDGYARIKSTVNYHQFTCRFCGQSIQEECTWSGGADPYCIYCGKTRY